MNTFEAIHIDRVELKVIDAEEFLEVGKNLVEHEENLQWALGDWADEATNRFGPKYLKANAKELRKPLSTIRRYRDVARKYPVDIRQEFSFVPWTIFRTLAPYSDRFNWLKRCHDEGWSFEKLKEMLKPSAIDDGKVVPPKPEMDFCVNCRRWYIVDPSQLCTSAGKCMEVK